jgi:catechol 2,3-dioxygenase-like lactoylglutathione lyase family enzyme
MPERLSSVVLFCRDAEACRAWYVGLGFAYLRGYEGMHWVGLGDVEVMLHPAETSSGGSGLCLHAAVADVDAAFARAREMGLDPYDHQQRGETLPGPVERPWGVREFELDDPEGHRWAFTQHG